MAGSQILILGARGTVASAIENAAGEGTITAARPPVSDRMIAFDATQTDFAQMFRSLPAPPSAVVIGFGISGVHTCAADPVRARNLNVDRVLAAARAAADIGALPVLFSTDSVFDGTPKVWHETDTPNPINEYGRQKYDVEQAAQAMGSCLIMRLSRVIGDHAHHRDILFQWSDDVRRRKTIPVPADQKFTPIAAADLGKIAVALINRGYRGLIHVAGERLISAPELFEIFRNELRRVDPAQDPKTQTCRVADLPGIDRRVPYTALSIDTLKQTLAPKFEPLTESVRHVVEAAFADVRAGK